MHMADVDARVEHHVVSVPCPDGAHDRCDRAACAKNRRSHRAARARGGVGRLGGAELPARIGRGRREPRSSPSFPARSRRPGCELTCSLSRRIADRAGGNRAAGTAGYRASVAHVRAELARAGYAPRVVGFPFVLYRESVEKGTQIAPTRRELRVEALDYSPSTPEGGPSRQGGRGRRRLRARRLRRRARLHRARTAGHLLLRRQGAERSERRRNRPARLQLGARTVRRHSRRSAGLLDPGRGDRRHRRTRAGGLIGLDRGAGARDATEAFDLAERRRRHPARRSPRVAGRRSPRLRPRRAGHQRQRDRRRGRARDRAGRAQEIPGACGALRLLGCGGAGPLRLERVREERRSKPDRRVPQLRRPGIALPRADGLQGRPVRRALARVLRAPRAACEPRSTSADGPTTSRSSRSAFRRAGCSQAATRATTARAIGSRASTSRVFDQLARAAAFGVASFAPIRR